MKVKESNSRRPRGIVTFIILMLLLSGSLRLSIAGIAFANNSPQKTEIGKNTTSNLRSKSDLEFLINALVAREAKLDEREATLNALEISINAAKANIETNLANLEAAEAELSKTIATVEVASEEDIQRLTNVYETMKPKNVAALFQEMSSEFAAGFLSQMNPDAAAGIMSALAPKKAHEISVVIAGRNAQAPKQ